jgi:hypothetical protein
MRFGILSRQYMVANKDDGDEPMKSRVDIGYFQRRDTE